MAVTVGQLIGEAEYTTLRSGINLVMGTPTGAGTGAAGYNQATSSPIRVSGNKITAADWNALKADADKAYTHQVGAAPDPALATVNTDTGITKTIHDKLETVVNFIKDADNRFTLGAGQFTTKSARSATKTNWNGTQTHDVTYTWDSANAAKAFFNAGGKLTFTSTLSYTGSEAKTVDWRTMMDPGTITMNHIDVTKALGTNGTITNSSGYYDLILPSVGEVEILNRNGANPYSENRYKIFARSITNGVRIRMQYQDNDVGDQTGLGAAVDENVKGTLTSALSYILPSGTNVQVDEPTIALGATNTF